MKFEISIVIILLSNFKIKVNADESESFTCGRRLVNHEALIVNGYESKEGEWPWHTSILHIEINQNIQYKCGGTLLNSQSVLTAAHCVNENDRPIVPDRVLTQLGRHNLKISGVHSQDIEVYQIFVHHNFNESSLTNDIAIVRLATKATFNNYVQPICLWDSSKKDLSEVVGKYGTTACNGDSGSGLTFAVNGIYHIRGIVSLTQARSGSHARRCKTDQLVIFTDVAKYLQWIRQIVPDIPSAESTTPQPNESSNNVKYCYFLNNDLTHAQIQRDDCEDRCASTPHCTHFTWTNYNDGTCWMKQNRVTAKDALRSVDRLAVCGIVENNAHIAWNKSDMAFGCDFWKNDLANVKTNDHHDCNNRCSSTDGCTHFAWNNYDGGTCWMKGNSVGMSDAFVSKDRSVACGVAKKIEWNENDCAVGCDFRGNDLRDVRSRRDECARYCATNRQCTHFTWNTAFGGTCWMKHFRGVTKNDAIVTADPSSVCGLI